MYRDKVFDQWVEDAENFEGDLVLFWAGRMSIAAGQVVRSNTKFVHKNSTARVLHVLSCMLNVLALTKVDDIEGELGKPDYSILPRNTNT